MKPLTSTLLMLLALLLVDRAGFAHHGLSRFDTSETISVHGNIVRVEWVNPHVFITIQALDENNGIVEWEIEGPPPAMLVRAGWSRGTLRVGDSIAASGNPTISTSNLLYGTNIQPVDGMEFDQSESISVLMDVELELESGADTLEGIWLTVLSPSQLAIYSGQGASDGLTDAGLRALNAFDESTMNPGIDCVRNPAPASMLMPDLKRISYEDGTIKIESNYDNATRSIHIGDRNSISANTTNQGFSIGSWEGNTLVVETTHFSGHAMGNKWGVPSGSRKQLREELTLNSDGKSISYNYELSDPEYLTDRITGEAMWVYRPDMEFATFECDIEASRRFL